MKLKDLVPHPGNPRKISDKQLEMLKKSLEKFGDLSGIVHNKRTGRLVGGHQRVKALSPESEIIDGFIHSNGERFVFREVDWDEDTEKAANIAANKHGGEFDVPKLADWLMDLDQKNFDMELVGFDAKELEDLCAPFYNMPSEGEDDVSETPKETSIRPGDLYSLGQHRLLCGDSTKKEDVEWLMNGEKADMVFTDPPYGMNLDTNYDDMYAFGDHTHTGNRFKKIEGDTKKYDPSPILNIESKRKFVFGCDYFYESLPAGGCFIAWDKRTENLDRVPGNTTEFCWAYPPVRRTSARILWSGHFEMNGDDSGKRLHPTQKPIKLVEWFFENWGKDTEIVVDIYLGSGSTLIACEKTNRKCYGIEIDPLYCQVIIDRWEKFTGKKASLIS